MDEETFYHVINEIPDIKVSDESIKSNIVFQCILALILITAFIPLRKRLLWLYAPNTRKKRNHPAHYHSKFTFSWFLPVITVSDVEILSVIGLDSFMVLQTLKLMYRMTFTIFLFLLPLVYVYFNGDLQETHQQIYLRLTIRTLGNNFYLVPLAYVYLISLFIFYMVFIYYKKHVALRQAYIRAPSLLTPLSTLKKLSFYHENFLDLVNIRARSVFMMRIPPFITNDSELRIFVEALGCGMIENCVLVKDTTAYETFTDERDYLVREIEGEIESVANKVIKTIKERAKTDENMKMLLKELKNINKQYDEKQIKHEDLVDVNEEDKENTSLAKRFLYSKNKYIKRYDKMDAFTYKLRKLETLHDNLSEEIKRLNKKPPVSKPSEEIIDLMNENNALYTRVDFANDVSFFSLQQIISIKKNWHAFSLDLPIGTRYGFVTFIDPKSAQMLPQCLISSRVFTCKSEPAPSPQDIIWDNINQGEVPLYFKRLSGSLIFIVFNLLFYTLALGIISLIQLESLAEKFETIKKLTRYEFFRDSFDGIITPLMFNTLLSISPIILTALTYYEGVSSYSQLYLHLMIRYGYFLIFNGFLMVFFASTTSSIIGNIMSGKFTFKNIATKFGTNLVNVSVFFTNAIIQRLVLGNILVVLKPVKLFCAVFLGKIQSMFGYVQSRRSLAESKMPNSVNFGDVYPNVLLVFPMALTFSVISPCMILLASMYYFVTYFVYKEEFLYSFINDYESGGTHWGGVSKMIIISLYILQGSTICHFIVNYHKREALLLVPLLIITYMYSNALKTMFGKSLEFYPLNEQEEIHTDAFTTQMVKIKKDVVHDWEEDMDPDDPTIIRCDDIVNKVEKHKIEDYPYRGSVEGVDCIMFPHEFFKKLRAIMKYDTDDSLGIFKEL